MVNLIGRITVLCLGLVLCACSPRITSVARFPTEGSAAPFGIACDVSEHEWYTEPTVGQIVERFKDGRTDVFQAKVIADDPTYLAMGDYSLTRVWFTEPRANRIGRVTAAGRVQEFPLPKRKSGPLGIADDHRGGAWFTEFSGNRIGHIDPNGRISEFTVPTRKSGPDRIALGYESVWFTERDGNKIGLLDAADKFTEFILPHLDSRPAGLVAQMRQDVGGPPGVWVSESGSGYIAYVTRSGRISEARVSANPELVVQGGGDDIWWADPTGLTIGNIFRSTENGSTVLFRFFGSMGDMAYCDDGSIWATEPNSRELIKMSISKLKY